MKSGLFFGVIVFGLALLAHANTANAQRQYRRYSPPAGPTLTPYLNYFRQDTGVVGDPYNSFVVPRRQLDNNLTSIVKQEQADVRAAKQQIDNLRKSEAGATGVGSSFMNYSHYYNMRSGGGQNRAR